MENEQTRANLDNIVRQTLFDTMGYELVEGGNTMHYTMDIEVTVEALSSLIKNLLSVDINEKIVWRLSPEGSPYNLQIPEVIKDIIKTYRKGCD
jgi:membrane carboxypeptidase/penicillin-binding protein